MSATNPFFRVDHQPREGRYDLHLSHANYDRDNGRFECRIKEDGTGVELYTLTVAVTVLLPPGPATITKSRYTRRHYHKSYSTLRSILSESCYYGFQTLRNSTCCLVSEILYLPLSTVPSLLQCGGGGGAALQPHLLLARRLPRARPHLDARPERGAAARQHDARRGPGRGHGVRAGDDAEQGGRRRGVPVRGEQPRHRRHHAGTQPRRQHQHQRQL